MKELTVTVTRRDIREGVAEDCKTCPIALAVRRQGRKKRISVYPWHFYVGDQQFRLPATAQNFINRFDDGLAVEPITFTATRVE